MVNHLEIVQRFTECGYKGGVGYLSTVEALHKGHCIVIIERTPIYVGAFSKDCKTVAEQYPDSCNIS